ncbi:LRP2-like protein [Mya arenaria]|uniref:LRP2-like protein n=1 Tax=Mya arenaria TaxID=6604 RepID=A0ABY7D8Y4_MYAAR|nr:LRP2-like protein [Mya arenaria]
MDLKALDFKNRHFYFHGYCRQWNLYQCIRRYDICDGEKNCVNGEDESFPTCDMDKCLQRGGFYCNSSRMCILTNNVCNGITNCIEAEDENAPACISSYTNDRCRRKGRIPVPTYTTNEVVECRPSADAVV